MLSWADACICGGGLTKYEAAYLGVPAAVLAQNADQGSETKEFVDLGLGWDLTSSVSRFCCNELTRPLEAFLSGNSLREAISKTALAAFPEDPTRTAAEALLELVA
jgi:spore coat polysaccharide biosynthesis predicted glycosyltransferase SpsG